MKKLINDIAIIHSCKRRADLNGCLVVVEEKKEKKVKCILVKSSHSISICPTNLLTGDAKDALIFQTFSNINALHEHPNCPDHKYIIQQSKLETPDLNEFLILMKDFPDAYDKFSKMGVEEKRIFIDVFTIKLRDL